MKALVKDGQHLAVRQIAPPQLQPRSASDQSASSEGDAEVVIRVVLAGLCRTDVYVAKGLIQAADPLVLGHEFSGIVEKTAPSETRLAAGDRVAVNPLLRCGRCEFCCGGAPSDCQQTRFLGVDLNGAFAEQVAVPASAVFPIPDHVSFATAAFAEPVAASLAVLRADIEPTQRGLVYGDNRIAQLTSRILKAHGFDRIDVLDPDTPSTASAPRLADNAYDFIVETLATTESLAAMIRALRPRGTLVLKSRQYLPVELVLKDLLVKEPRLQAVYYAPFPQAIGLLAEGRIEVDDLVGPVYELESFDDVFESASRGEDRKPFFQLAKP